MKRSLSALVMVFAFVAGCDSEDDKAKDSKASAPKTVYTCKIGVAAKLGDPETFKGQGEGEDEEKAEAQAWEAACNALPEADREACRDNEKFKWALGGMSTEVDGVKKWSKTITLTRVQKAEEFEAEVESEESDEAACKDALAQACEKAGAKGDCVAAGTHDQRSRRSRKEMK